MNLETDQTGNRLFDTVDGIFAIVERSLAIAMDIEATLRARGARHVLVAASEVNAIELLARGPLAVAIIDSRFADPGPSSVATRYLEAGIPVVLLNADPAFSAPGLLRRVRMLAKPHCEKELVSSLLASMRRS